MAATLTNFASSETRLKYREPFITEGLNAKIAVALPPGTYRGFRLAATGSGTPRSLQIVADTTSNDNVAIFQTATGYSVSLTKSGNFTVDLSSASFNNTTVIIAIYANYTLGAVTTAALKAYTLAEYNAAPEQDQLVVLGSVVTTGSGVAISAGNITYARRTEAWEAIAPQQVPYTNVVRNGGFETILGATPGTYEIPFWRANLLTTASTWAANDTDPSEGEQCIQYDFVDVAPQASLVCPIGAPTIPGRVLKYSFDVKALKSLAGGTFQLLVAWADHDDLSTQSQVSIPMGSIDGSYRNIAGAIVAPSDARFLSSVSFVLDSADFGTAGAALRLDNVRAWLENASTLNEDINAAGWALQRTNALVLTTIGTVASPGAVLEFNSGTLGISSTAGAATAVAVTGTLAVTGTVTSGGTLAASGDLTVGDDAVITGDLTVGGQVLGTLAVAGDATIGDDIAVTGDITVTGTIYRSYPPRHLHPSIFQASPGDWTYSTAAGGEYFTGVGDSGGELQADIGLGVGDRITLLQFLVDRGIAPATMTLKLTRVNFGGTPTTVFTSTLATGSGKQLIDIVLGAPHVIQNNHFYYASVESSDEGAFFYGAVMFAERAP